MTPHPGSESLENYCRLFGIALAPSSYFERLIGPFADRYISVFSDIGAPDAHPAILVSDVDSYDAHYLSGTLTQGVVVDRSYLDTFSSLASEFQRTEPDFQRLFQKFVALIADKLRVKGAVVHSLALRHERLSNLYTINALQNRFPVLPNVEQLDSILPGYFSRETSGEAERQFAFVVLHECGHFFHEQNAGLPDVLEFLDNIGRRFQLDLSSIDRTIATAETLDLNNPIERHLDQVKNLSEEWVRSETFADLFAIIIYASAAAKEGKDWLEALADLYVFQEVKHLIDRTEWLSLELLQGDFDDFTPPTTDESLVARLINPTHQRTSISREFTWAIFQEAYRDFGNVDIGSDDEVKSSIEQLRHACNVQMLPMSGPALDLSAGLVLHLTAVRVNTFAGRKFFKDCAAFLFDQDRRAIRDSLFSNWRQSHGFSSTGGD